MLLQLAIDCFTLQEALHITEEVAELVDIVEAGTPLVLREGIHAVRRLKEEFPSLIILADMKIVDGAQYESELAFDAGADIVTVLAAAEDETIAISAHTAQSYGKEIMVDLIGVKRRLERASEIEKLGAHHICTHRATDLGPRGDGLQNELKQLRAVSGSMNIAVAGGIDLKALKAMKDPLPDIAIVGSYITADSNRREAAQRIRQAIHTQGN